MSSPTQLTCTHRSELEAKYIVGLSRIKAFNGVRLVVWDRNAEVLMFRHIESSPACYSAAAYKALRRKFAADFGRAERFRGFTGIEHAWVQGDVVYVDTDMWGRSDELQTEMIDAMCDSPYSGIILGSSEYVFRFGGHPAPVVVEEDGAATAVKVRDEWGRETLFPLPPAPSVNSSKQKRSAHQGDANEGVCPRLSARGQFRTIEISRRVTLTSTG